MGLVAPPVQAIGCGLVVVQAIAVVQGAVLHISVMQVVLGKGHLRGSVEQK